MLQLQGSEAEVQALQSVDQQPQLVVEAQRKRCHYGGPAEFTEESAGMLLDLFPRMPGRPAGSQAHEDADGAAQAPDIQMLEHDMSTQVCSTRWPPEKRKQQFRQCMRGYTQHYVVALALGNERKPS